MKRNQNMKKLGLIGGTGPESTLIYYKIRPLIDMILARYGAS